MTNFITCSRLPAVHTLCSNQINRNKKAMIFVNGLPLSSSPSQENENLTALLEHPSLVAAANLFKAVPEIKYSVPEECIPEKSSIARHVYVFQREYAIVDPAMVEFVGTDEATTCVGLVIRNQKNGMTSIAHLDSPEIVDLGLNQMLSLVINEIEAQLDVHLIGCFEDVVYEQANGKSRLGSREHSAGHSLPLCSKIVESLQTRRENFHIQILCVLGHNTRRDTDGVAYPIANGFLVETSTGSIRPAIFDRSSRCPDELVRRIRATVSSLDPQWKGRLLETYDSKLHLVLGNQIGNIMHSRCCRILIQKSYRNAPLHLLLRALILLKIKEERLQVSCLKPENPGVWQQSQQQNRRVLSSVDSSRFPYRFQQNRGLFC